MKSKQSQYNSAYEFDYVTIKQERTGKILFVVACAKTLGDAVLFILQILQ